MDQFIAAFRDAVQNNYANFEGRLGVGGYWRFVAVNILISIVVNILVTISSVFLVVAVIVWLALLIPGLAATVRRLHDTGKSGWFILIGLIPLVGLIVLIVWTVKEGDSDVNEYGAPPTPIAA